jgi:hypothetical protein
MFAARARLQDAVQRMQFAARAHLQDAVNRIMFAARARLQDAVYRMQFAANRPVVTLTTFVAEMAVSLVSLYDDKKLTHVMIGCASDTVCERDECIPACTSFFMFFMIHTVIYGTF